MHMAGVMILGRWYAEFSDGGSFNFNTLPDEIMEAGNGLLDDNVPYKQVVYYFHDI